MAHELKEKVDLALLKIETHCEAMEGRQYQTSDELIRDMAIGIELACQYIDLLAEISEIVETEGVA